jgi:hypothetical protein
MQCLIFTIIALSVAAGCDRPRDGTRPVESPSAGTGHVHVFHDRRDARYEWVFILRGQGVVAERHVFPGYADATAFRLDTLPTQLLARVLQFASKPGDVRSPFPPHGPWFSRTDVPTTPGTAPPATEFFASDNKDLLAMFSDLQAEALRSGKSVSELPEWVRANADLRKHLGRRK